MRQERECFYFWAWENYIKRKCHICGIRVALSWSSSAVKVNRQRQYFLLIVIISFILKYSLLVILSRRFCIRFHIKSLTSGHSHFMPSPYLTSLAPVLETSFSNSGALPVECSVKSPNGAASEDVTEPQRHPRLLRTQPMIQAIV